MPTNAQLKTIHNGARVVGLIESDPSLEKSQREARYRLLLRNIGGVQSASDLDNEGVEDVMAVIEGMGFNRHPKGPTYWQDTVSARGSVCSRRMVHKIRELANAQFYDLPALCRRQSAGRTDVVEQLLPREGWMLIEALKAIKAREAEKQQA